MNETPASDSRPGDSFLALVRSDLQRYAEAEGRAVSRGLTLRMLFLMPGFQFVLARRIQDLLYGLPIVGRTLGRICWWWTCRSFGAEIAIAAVIGRGLYVPHPYGIVVGICRVGDGVTILQNVTIGKKSRAAGGAPVIGNDVYLAAGAVIVGDLVIGDHASIGANSVVIGDIPTSAVAVGAPAKVVGRTDGTQRAALAPATENS
jgi:serine O-acetyltransferase